MQFIVSWSEAQVTTWTCDWGLNWGSQGVSSLVGLSPWPLKSDAISR